MDAVAFFGLLAELMKTNPPAPADAPEVAKFARIGLVPGRDFDASTLRADLVKRIPQLGFDRIMLQFEINRDVKHINGWNFTTKTGIYGTDYLMRALVTAIGLGAQDAVYPTSLKDADDRDYEGTENTSSTSARANCRRSKGSGPSPGTMPTISSSPIRSTAIRSVRGRTSRRMLTALSIS